MRRGFIIIASVMVLSGATYSQSEESQEKVARQWIEAFNSADVAKMAEFRSRNFENPGQGWEESFLTLVDRLGRLEIYGMMRTDEELVIGVESEKQGRVRFSFRFAGDRIVSVGPHASREFAGPQLKAPGDWNQKRPVIDAYLKDLAKKDLFAGTVMIVERGEIRFRGAYGLASREFNVPNTLETRFDVGSFNKDYTRLAILQLLEKGKLQLSDTVGKHLPDYPNPEVREKVTIEQLLFHRSGLGDYFTEEWDETPMQKLREIDDYIPIWGPKPLLSEPGEKERYSNYGYTVLGAIIEKSSGLSYPDYVVQNIFKPAGMVDSGFFEVDAVVPNVAVGYTRHGPRGRRNGLYKNIFLEPAKGGPWGKSYSTVMDLYRFFEAMFEGRFLSEKNNWLRWDIEFLGLAGGGPGLNATLEMQGGVMVLVLANLDPPASDRVAQALLRAVR